MKKLTQLIFTLALGALSLNSAAATEFTVEETRLLHRSSTADMKNVLRLIPAAAGDTTLADPVRRVSSTIDGGAAPTIPSAVSTLRHHIAGAAGAHAEADLALLRKVVTSTPGTNALEEVNTVKASIGTATQFDAAHAVVTAALPATGGPGVSGQFIDGTIGTTAIGVSGTAGTPDALNEETRALLHLLYRRFTVSITTDGDVPDDQGYLNDGNDSASGLARAASILRGIDENTVTLSDITRVAYAISLHGTPQDLKDDKFGKCPKNF
jgi:hypothetical protein